MVRVRLGRPVIYRQLRPGLHGRPFTIYKFRTMLDTTDTSGRPLPSVQRTPPFGQRLRQLSLDELPELLNVIKGDMSMVGPRPLMMSYLPRYNSEQARRHDVRPGITGLAQISGRNALSWEDRFALDVQYVDDHTVLDGHLDYPPNGRRGAVARRHQACRGRGHDRVPRYHRPESDKRRRAMTMRSLQPSPQAEPHDQCPSMLIVP